MADLHFHACNWHCAGGIADVVPTARAERAEAAIAAVRALRARYGAMVVPMDGQFNAGKTATLMNVLDDLDAALDSTDPVEAAPEEQCPHLADVLAGRARGPHDDSTCGWCARLRAGWSADGQERVVSATAVVSGSGAPSPQADSVMADTPAPKRKATCPQCGLEPIADGYSVCEVCAYRPRSDAGLPADGEERK